MSIILSLLSLSPSPPITSSSLFLPFPLPLYLPPVYGIFIFFLSLFRYIADVLQTYGDIMYMR